MKKKKKTDVEKWLEIIGLFKNVSKDVPAVYLALKRGGKVALASGAAGAALVLLGLLEVEAEQGNQLLQALFIFVPSTAVVAALSKWLREKYGIQLPF